MTMRRARKDRPGLVPPRDGRAHAVRLGLRRLAHIIRIFLVHGSAVLAGRLGARHPGLRRRLPGDGLSGPERLRTLFEDLGGTFVKFGQMLAMQPDIVPLEYCDALLKLLDRMEPFPFPDAERIVREELGRPPDAIFDDFERAPIATASVGQVHAAWLHGKKVAVKVQRPNAHLEFGNDVRLMVGAMRLIRGLRIRPLYWMLAPTSEFVAWSTEELDYRNEARYSEELRRHAVGNPIQHVPAVFRRQTARRVLTVEFLEGITLLDAMRARELGDEVVLRRLEKLGFDQGRFAANIISNFLGDAFRHGIYHADLHPANLMILAGNVVGYIDFGITGLMSPYSRRHLVAMTLALAEGDLETMYREYLTITSHDEASDLRGFRAGLTVLADTWYEDDGGRRRLRTKITRIFSEMLQLSRQTNVMPERDIVKYIRSAISIDGLLSRFAPGFEIGSHLAENCSRYLKGEARRELLTPENLLAWSTAGGRLLAGGPLRVSRALGQIARREELDGGEPSFPEDEEEGAAALRTRTLQLAGSMLGVSLLIAASSGPWRFGLNLLTAELAFLAGASALLAGSIHRLAR
jgi:ubiquinone biosynthesis protein